MDSPVLKDHLVVVELETDLDWDFGHSLRQIKRYRDSGQFGRGVVVIISQKTDDVGLISLLGEGVSGKYSVKSL